MVLHLFFLGGGQQDRSFSSNERNFSFHFHFLEVQGEFNQITIKILIIIIPFLSFSGHKSVRGHLKGISSFSEGDFSVFSVGSWNIRHIIYIFFSAFFFQYYVLETFLLGSIGGEFPLHRREFFGFHFLEEQGISKQNIFIYIFMPHSVLFGGGTG